jgi:superfamily II DNA or RNA helicase
MVQTVTRNLESEPCPSVIITDENHHCLATSYTNIYDRFSDAIKLGFTATPVRMGGIGLGKIYNKLVGDIKIKWLIENKYLSPYRLYSKKLVDTTELHTQRGDYNKKETESLMGTRVIYGETVKTYNELAAGKKTIVYCAGIDSSTATRDAFIKTGINACHLDANTPKQERLEAVAKFRAGEILVLCNVDLFSEGEYQSPCIVKAV